MACAFDFAAAWGGEGGPPPELPQHLWDTIVSGGHVAGLVEPHDAYGRLTAVMALDPRQTHDYATGAVGFRLRGVALVVLTFLPRHSGHPPVDVEFDVRDADDRAVMIELIAQQSMTAMWIDAAELVVIRRARLALDGARRLVTRALTAA
jgi:hypothetical protein